MVFVFLYAADVVGIGCKNTIQGTEYGLTVSQFHTLLYTNYMYPNNVNNTGFIFSIPRCRIITLFLSYTSTLSDVKVTNQTANILIK